MWPGWTQLYAQFSPFPGFSRLSQVKMTSTLQQHVQEHAVLLEIVSKEVCKVSTDPAALYIHRPRQTCRNSLLHHGRTRRPWQKSAAGKEQVTFFSLLLLPLHA